MIRSRCKDLASTNHKASAEAIASGLSSGSRIKLGETVCLLLNFHIAQTLAAYWIQISGASMFSVPGIKAGRYDDASAEVYDDIRAMLTKSLRS